MRKYHTPSDELIEAVRRCAAAKMSMADTADELTTRLHPLSRSSIAGIAHRHGIKFTKKASNRTRHPKDRRTIPARLPKTDADPLLMALKDKHSAPNFSTINNARPHVAKPGPRCSWAACGDYAEPGDMFCSKHAKKGLFAAG